MYKYFSDVCNSVQSPFETSMLTQFQLFSFVASLSSAVERTDLFADRERTLKNKHCLLVTCGCGLWKQSSRLEKRGNCLQFIFSKTTFLGNNPISALKVLYFQTFLLLPHLQGKFLKEISILHSNHVRIHSRNSRIFISLSLSLSLFLTVTHERDQRDEPIRIQFMLNVIPTMKMLEARKFCVFTYAKIMAWIFF